MVLSRLDNRTLLLSGNVLRFATRSARSLVACQSTSSALGRRFAAQQQQRSSYVVASFGSACCTVTYDDCLLFCSVAVKRFVADCVLVCSTRLVLGAMPVNDAAETTAHSACQSLALLVDGVVEDRVLRC